MHSFDKNPVEIASKLVSKGIKEFEALRYMRSVELFIRAYNVGDLPDEVAATCAFNVATTLMDVSEYTRALQWCDRSLSHRFDHNVAYTRSLILMHLQNREAGLKSYHHRYLKTATDAVSFPKLPLEFYDSKIECGEVFVDKRVLVLNEQGFGDEIMFLRTMEHLNRLVKSAHVQVYPELYELIKTTQSHKFNNITFFCERSLSLEFVNSFDCWTSTGCLWAQFTLNNVPMQPLHFEPIVAEKSDKFRIGFILSPNKKSKNSIARSIDEKYIKQLTKLPNVEVVNLQYGTTYNWCNSANIESFYDTYKEMSAVDLIICCDTGAAHLAVGMSKPFFLVYNGYIDWRWADSTYYPDAKKVKAAQLLNRVKELL